MEYIVSIVVPIIILIASILIYRWKWLKERGL